MRGMEACPKMNPSRISAPGSAILVSLLEIISELSPSSDSHCCLVGEAPLLPFRHLPQFDLFCHPHGALLHQDFSGIPSKLNFTPPTIRIHVPNLLRLSSTERDLDR